MVGGFSFAVHEKTTVESEIMTPLLEATVQKIGVEMIDGEEVCYRVTKSGVKKYYHMNAAKERVKGIVRHIVTASKQKYGSGFFELNSEIYTYLIENDYKFKFNSREDIFSRIGKNNMVGRAFNWAYVELIQRKDVETGPVGSGLIRFLSNEEVEARNKSNRLDAEAALSNGGSGYIYAYTKPSVQSFYMTESGATRIKIGRTMRDPLSRIRAQFGTSECEHPVVLRTWKVKEHIKAEALIHDALEEQGKHVKQVSGTEWFTTSVDEIEQLFQLLNIEIVPAD